MLSREALIALSRIGKYPDRKINELIKTSHNAGVPVHALIKSNALGYEDSGNFESLLSRESISLITRADKSYPDRLKNFDELPLAIYCRGHTTLLKNPKTVGIVGTRKASQYGIAQATAISRQLSICGYTVISGLAAGIDAASHKAALDAGGETIAVLGTPIDRIYPSQNEALARRILESKSLIVSEYPPKIKTEKYHFVFRNRMIAALSDIVVIVEAPERSGALATAGYAMEYGKDVYVVPADINKPSFLGSNRLIGQGAFIFTSINDFLENIGLDKKPARDILKSDQIILDAIVSCDGNFDRMLECLRENPAKLNVDLMRLEIEGLVKKDIIGKYYLI